MRHADREITEFEEIVQVLDQCDTIRIAMFDEEYPYIVPVSFGYEVSDGKIVVYFHGAKEGKKHDLLKKNAKVCVEADLLHGYKKTGRSITADYMSVIGFGEAQLVEGAEAVKGIELLLIHCKTEGYSAEDCVALGITDVHKVMLDQVTGKKRF